MNGKGRIEQDVLAVLSGCTVEGPVVKIRGQLDRKLYERVNKVLEALGGKWDRRLRGHLFADDPAERLDGAILTASYERHTRDGFFETPLPVAEQLTAALDLKPGMTLLEPSAGRGALLRPAERIIDRFHMTLVEIRPDNVAALRALGSARGSGFPRIFGGDFLAIEPSPGPGPFSSDPAGLFDRIIMNPPFERLQDVDHVTHALRFLKPGGRLGAIMGPGWTFRQDKKAQAFRELIVEPGGVERTGWRWELLPEGSFKASGTGVNAGILVVEGEG